MPSLALICPMVQQGVAHPTGCLGGQPVPCVRLRPRPFLCGTVMKQTMYTLLVSKPKGLMIGITPSKTVRDSLHCFSVLFDPLFPSYILPYQASVLTDIMFHIYAAVGFVHG